MYPGLAFPCLPVAGLELLMLLLVPGKCWGHKKGSLCLLSNETPLKSVLRCTTEVRNSQLLFEMWLLHTGRKAFGCLRRGSLALSDGQCSLSSFLSLSTLHQTCRVLQELSGFCLFYTFLFHSLGKANTVTHCVPRQPVYPDQIPSLVCASSCQHQLLQQWFPILLSLWSFNTVLAMVTPTQP